MISLKFALFTKPEVQNLSSENKLIPSPIKRDLKIIFNKHQEFSERNTLLVTNFKNEISDYRNNEINIPLYHPTKTSVAFNADAHLYYTTEYVIILNSLRINMKCNVIC